MITHDLIQGSPEWDAFRLEHFGASEAAAMLGLSKKVTRTELLHMKHTGNAKEFSDWVQKNILDYGHEVEALARPIIEEIFGIDLYPVTCSDGLLSASCDGLTLCETTAFEHKQWNKELAQMVSNGDVPEFYMPQCQQIMMVTGAKRVIFVVSDGTRENMVWMEVFPDQGWFERIRAGWAQFERDLAEYVPVQVIEPPKAPAPKELPVVSIQVRGELTMSNLSDVTPHFDRFLGEAKTTLVTDEDFAIADSESKLGRETAKRCKLTAKAVVGQILSISDVVRTLEEYAAKFDALALKQEKAVKEQKDERKADAKKLREKQYEDHIKNLNLEIAPVSLVLTAADKPDFVGAMKNQRLLSSLYDKLDTELARAKISADSAAKDIRAKLAWHKENAKEYEFLFADLQSIIQKPADDFQLLVQNRIEQHRMDEKRRLEAERERIQKEEQRKAEEAAQERIREGIRKAEENARIQAEAQRKAEEALRAQQSATYQLASEAPKPVLVKSEPKAEPSYSPALFHLAIHELRHVRKKFSQIAELAGVMREIDQFLKAQEKTA